MLSIHLNGFIICPNPYFWIPNPIHLIGFELNLYWIIFWILKNQNQDASSSSQGN